MTTKTIKLASIQVPMGVVTQGHWGCSTETSSATPNELKISVYSWFYVYKRKPSWFGEWPDDRYLGKSRWVSRRADGTQWKCVDRKAACNKWVLFGANHDELSRQAKEIQLAYGYLQPYLGSRDIRASRKIRDYSKGIRCAVCGNVAQVVANRISKLAYEMVWPTRGERLFSDLWDARDHLKQAMGCACIH